MSAFLDEPFNPSPYAPVSRLFWNEFYVNVDSIPELEACPEARDLIASAAFQRDLARLRSNPLVDYRGVMAMKRRVLSLLATVLSGPRLDAFGTFLRDRPQLRDYACFRAAGDRYRARWTEWPDPARSGRLDGADLDPDSVRYHQYVQWLADSQLNSLARDAADSGVSLYFDLPIGASRDSYDVWRQRSVFAEHASVGAPPDTFFPQGQDWAFPPPHPDAVRAEGYALFIAVVRRLLELSGVLRIDHVMGLHRLYWIPEGLGAADGVYVHYRPEEMYAILCLESHRYGAIIVGEDLGTVPPYVPKSLARHNIYSMYVLQYALSGEGPPRVAHARRRAVAGLNTHDTPPFAAWLKGADIDDALRLGFLSREAADPARAARSAQKQTLSRLLHGRRLAPRAPSRRDLLLGSLRYLASSRSEMMLVNLEDLWLETRSQNIPGTTADRHPNWRRKAARTLEDIEADAGIARTLREVNSARTAGRP
jgi:4-alpha-glucanotransferase